MSIDFGDPDVAARAFALRSAIDSIGSQHFHHGETLSRAQSFYEWLKPTPVPTQVSLTFDPPTDIQEEVPLMATLNDGQQIVAHVSELDAKGNPVSVPGTWSVDRTDLLGMEVSADGLSATFTALGPIGSAVVSLTVGSLPTATASVDIVPGDVATVSVNFDAPTDQAPATPPAAPAAPQG